MNSKKIIFPILVLFCMLLIFCFSHQNAQKSQSVSDEVALKTIEIKAGVLHQNISKSEKDNFVENTRVFFRKSAHFIIYCMLGILLYMTFKSYHLKYPEILDRLQ